MKTIITLISAFIFSSAFSQGVPLPYNTGFDSSAEKAGWQQFRTKFLSTYSWSYGPGFAGTGVSHDYNVGGNPNDTVIDWFISPALNITGPATMSIKVKTGGFSTPFPDNFEVLFGSNIKNPVGGNYTVIANLSNMAPQYQWLDTTFIIPFVSDSSYIALKYKTIGAAWMTYAFDNISIVAAASSVNENESENALEVFPNPFAESTRLQSKTAMRDASVLIYDVKGSLVKTIFNVYGNVYDLNCADLQPGIYVAAMSENGRILARKRLSVIR
jgi:hypothetical protein